MAPLREQGHRDRAGPSLRQAVLGDGIVWLPAPDGLRAAAAQLRLAARRSRTAGLVGAVAAGPPAPNPASVFGAAVAAAGCGVHGAAARLARAPHSTGDAHARGPWASVARNRSHTTSHTTSELRCTGRSGRRAAAVRPSSASSNWRDVTLPRRAAEPRLVQKTRLQHQPAAGGGASCTARAASGELPHRARPSPSGGASNRAEPPPLPARAAATCSSSTHGTMLRRR
jgi:hypothetical protein